MRIAQMQFYSRDYQKTVNSLAIVQGSYDYYYLVKVRASAGKTKNNIHLQFLQTVYMQSTYRNFLKVRKDVVNIIYS